MFSEDDAIVVHQVLTILAQKVAGLVIVTVLVLWIISVTPQQASVNVEQTRMVENVISVVQAFGDSLIVKDVIAMDMRIFAKPKPVFVLIAETIPKATTVIFVLTVTMEIQELMSISRADPVPALDH
ncbi:hypothetical protein NQ314_007924 [Rhamnusium bicolor]|uniref:Uncharacterized protein n=1 Tax=Rhamnusium bicolor TaxID=1586634 RepID=A0AAV8YHU6_9CUCU|nr:hypothetical protein NQ314_007924 [Rhamnusium bicolor]